MSKKKKQSAASSPESAEPSGKSSSTHVNLTSEGAEPRAEGTSIPAMLVVILAILLFVADMYLMENRGEFNPVVYQPHASLEDIQAQWPIDPVIEERKKGKKVYETCSACHQPNGLGTPGSFPPLVGSEWVLAEGPERIIRIVLHGLQGPITVNGQAFNNVMPPFGPVFTDAEIAAVLTYIRGEWGNKASRVTPEQVAKVRKERPADAPAWTVEALLKTAEK